MDEEKVEGQTQPQVSSAANPASSSGNAKVISRFGESITQPKVQPAQPQVQQTQANVPPKTNAAPTAPIANSAQASTPQPAQSVPTTYYSASTSKTAQKIDPFAEQNAKRAEKKAKTKKQAKKGIIISVIVVIILIAIGIILWLIFRPPAEVIDLEAQAWTNESQKIQDAANTIYKQASGDGSSNANGAINVSAEGAAAASDYFNEQYESTTETTQKNTIILSEMQFYNDLILPEQIVAASKKIADLNLLTEYQLNIYTALVYNSYGMLGDEENANYWYNFSLEHGLINTSGE